MEGGEVHRGSRHLFSVRFYLVRVEPTFAAFSVFSSQGQEAHLFSVPPQHRAHCFASSAYSLKIYGVVD